MNVVFIQVYLLNHIYIHYELIPFSFFFCALLFIHSGCILNNSFQSLLIGKKTYAFILFILENNSLRNCTSALTFLTVVVWRGDGEVFCFKNFIFPVSVVLVTAGKSVKGYVASSQ